AGPRGLGPIRAAYSPQLVQGPMPAHSVPASSPNAFTVVVSGAPRGPAGPMMPVVLSDAGTPSGMANAFTPGHNSQPIPADLTRYPYDPNAFHETGMGGAERRPVMQVGYYLPLPMPMPFPAQPAYYQHQGPDTGRLLLTLKDSVMPSQREL